MMRVEFKRRFLVIDDGWRRAVAGVSVVRDGLLAAASDRTVRIRIDGARASLIILRAHAGLRRARFDYEIPILEARELLASHIQGHPIERRRHRVPHAGCVWSVDVYGGTLAGLALAEIDLDEDDRALERPDWIGAEVSDDPRYSKTALLHSARSSIGRPSLVGAHTAILEV